MPNKKRYARRPKRRRNKRLAKQRGINTAFPHNRTVTLRYCDVISLDPAAGVVAKHQFRANSIFDPDSTGVGHQPKGRDEWAEFYHHYVVVGAKITCQFTGSGTNQPGAILGVGLVPTTGGLGSTPGDIAENGTANWQVGGVSANDSLNHSITAFYSAKQFYNITDIKDNIDRLGASIGSNPSEDVFFEVFFGPLNGTVDLVRSDILVTIEYIVSMSEPKTLAQS